MSKKDEEMFTDTSPESEVDGDLSGLFDEDTETESKGKGKVDKMSAFRKIPVTLTLEVDSVPVLLSDIVDLSEGDVLPLSKKIDEPLDVRVNGKLIARAEVVLVDGHYGLRLMEILQSAKEKDGATG